MITVGSDHNGVQGAWGWAGVVRARGKALGEEDRKGLKDPQGLVGKERRESP